MIGVSILLAFREIRRHLLRSFLTVLGVVIGVFSVVTMVTLGNGATQSIKASISALGADMLQIRPGQSGGPGNPSGGEAAPAFKLADVEAMRTQLAGVTAVAAQAQSTGAAIRNAQNWNTTITGTSNDFFVVQKWAVEQGRTFSPEEEQAGSSVCVIGTTIVSNLFQDHSPLGESFRIKGVSCRVIGVLKSRGQGGFGGDQDDVVLMPIKAVQRQMTGNQDVRAVIVGVDPQFDGNVIRDALVALLRERRGLAPDVADNFSVLDAKQISDTVSGTVGILTVLVGAVASISLLVGGIGIMNIMLVSVTERTREIGTRLAIGALGEEVLMQFLVESVVLSCLGGLIGITLAFVVCAGTAPLMGIPFLFSLGVNLLSFAFSALIGVLFGYFPARRAAELNPIEALRYE